MKRKLIIGMAGLVLALSVNVPAQGQETDELPKYYQFFMKTGQMEAIEAEVERDELIEAGTLVPVAVNEPIQDFDLPDGFGNTIGLRDYIGKKNIVLTTFRTWW